ncbi:MAG: GntR family transcriptional regulator [Hyphomicrobiales bacterium]
MRDQIYDLLRAEIVTGTIPPGGVIDEKNIASALKVSRTPVREAVKKLSDEHLVEVVAQSGTRAAPLDREECARPMWCAAPLKWKARPRRLPI